MRVALIQGDSADDGRALKVARALRRLGHEATLVVPQTGLQVSLPACALAWQAEGFCWIPVGAGHLPPQQPHYPRDASFIAAKALSDIVLAFDVAWFFEAEWAMPALRERRFFMQQLPLVVLDLVERTEPVPASLAEINQAFARSYAAQWADLTYSSVSTEDAALDARVEQVATLFQARKAAPPRTRRQATTSPAATVCIPYFEEPEFLSQALLSLERQTSNDFTVVVVDDGSHTNEAKAAFDTCSERYAARGWRFIRQPNASAAAARNHAVREAVTEFVIFLDADDIAAPNLVEQFLAAVLLTGDDCLVARNYGFRDDPEGPCNLLYDPPGNSLVGSMADDMHGGSCMIFRREAFLHLGGFTEIRGIGFEDYELHVRANLSGLRWDVLPAFVYRYRAPRAKGVSRSTSAYANMARITQWYQQRLQPYGLGQLPLALSAAYRRDERACDTADSLQAILARSRSRRSAKGREVKLLLLACNFPYGLVSGWHTRVQQLIRYFGSRYELTLMTAMPREQLGPVRKQTFQHLHAVLGVEGSSQTAATEKAIPFRVREHYTDLFQAALRSLPTDQYHAALLDQIFMAEFRKDIDAATVLTEHNIESRLLRQASERAWAGALPLHYQNAFTQAALLERYEDQAWRDIPLRAVVSEIDRAEMLRRVPTGKVVVASNGADLSTWLPHARFQARTVLFAGHLAYLPNVDAVEFLLTEIWPKVRRQSPSARLILAGRDPSTAVLAAVERAGSHLGIELCASPESMEDVARRASITVAPLRLGSGTRCKILDSMAWGLPVVSTTLGAEGIDVQDGEHLLVRDDPASFAEAIVRLLSDAALWQTFRDASGELVRARYSWDRVFDPLNDALLELIA
jgi:GT2 family glycosyltransferase/glycosyltransferase involved in cell wall biosynthesis